MTTKTSGHATLATAPEAPPPFVRPDWLVKPDSEAMARVYPRGAQDRNIDGKAVVLCRVRPDTRLSDCELISETPMGEGFGAAALELTSTFRMSPGTGENPTVTIPVVFKVPQSRPSGFDAALPGSLVATIRDLAREGLPRPSLDTAGGVGMLIATLVVGAAIRVYLRRLRMADAAKDLSGPNSDGRKRNL